MLSQAAYTALQELEAHFPTAGEEVARLKEEVYALLEERAQHVTQRKWRQMQKKRARESAAASARNQRRSADAENMVQSCLVSVPCRMITPELFGAAGLFAWATACQTGMERNWHTCDMVFLDIIKLWLDQGCIIVSDGGPGYNVCTLVSCRVASYA